MIRTTTQREIIDVARVYHAQGWPIHDSVMLAADHAAPYGHTDLLDDDADSVFWH